MKAGRPNKIGEAPLIDASPSDKEYYLFRSYL
ncbi:hypothetical+protein [Methylocapsa aurea]